jgi:SHS2 domain-containing protein
MRHDSDNEDILIVEHTADWALRLRGRDLNELFTRAAEGMAYLLAGDVSIIPLTETRELALEAYDAEELLVVWLGELAYWAERDGLVFPVADLSEVTPEKLTGAVRGGRPLELQKHIKAVTYHDLKIRQTDKGLEVTVVFDV